ncbi:MAG: hypothetical protein ACJ788_06945 [Ktedonobacteraceae bacterium]
MMIKVSRKSSGSAQGSDVIGKALYVLALLIMLVLCAPLPTYADGGAPNLAYVAGTKQGISTIDIGQKAVTGTISINGDPRIVLLSLDGRFLYVAQPSLGRVTMIAAKTGQTVCSAKLPGQPSLLVFDPAAGSNIVYAAGNGDASISALDATTCAVKNTFKTNGPVYGLAAASVGAGSTIVNQIWASTGDALSILDTTGKQLASIPIAGGPQYISTPPGIMAYVTTRQGSVDAVNLGTHKVFTLLTGGTFGPMDYDAITGEVYVPDQRNKQIDVLTPLSSDATPLPTEPNHTYKLGVSPQSIAITSDGQLGFVALSGGNVAMIDVPGKEVVDTIFVGGNPHFIITGLYPPLVGTTPQQASTWSTVINILAYVFVAALLIVPILLFRRFNRAGATKRK